MRSRRARAPHVSSSPTRCAQRDAPAKVISDYALVVSELVTNIIEHGDGSSLVIYLDRRRSGVVGGRSRRWFIDARPAHTPAARDVGRRQTPTSRRVAGSESCAT